MFSCEICEIFKNTYFEQHLRTTASKLSETRISQKLTFDFGKFGGTFQPLKTLKKLKRYSFRILCFLATLNGSVVPLHKAVDCENVIFSGKSFRPIQRRIQNPVKHLRWNFLRKSIAAITPSQMFDRVLNTPLPSETLLSLLLLLRYSVIFYMHVAGCDENTWKHLFVHRYSEKNYSKIFRKLPKIVSHWVLFM